MEDTTTTKSLFEKGIMPKDIEHDSNFMQRIDLEIPMTEHTNIKLSLTLPKAIEDLPAQVREKNEIVYVLPDSFALNNNFFKSSNISARAAAVLVDALSQLNIIARFNIESQAKLINWLFGYGKRSAEKLIAAELRYIMETHKNKPSTATLEEVAECVDKVMNQIDSQEIDMPQLEDLALSFNAIVSKLKAKQMSKQEALKAMNVLKEYIERNIKRVREKLEAKNYHSRTY